MLQRPRAAFHCRKRCLAAQVQRRLSRISPGSCTRRTVSKLVTESNDVIGRWFLLYSLRAEEGWGRQWSKAVSRFCDCRMHRHGGHWTLNMLSIRWDKNLCTEPTYERVWRLGVRRARIQRSWPLGSYMMSRISSYRRSKRSSCAPLEEIINHSAWRRWTLTSSECTGNVCFTAYRSKIYRFAMKRHRDGDHSALQMCSISLSRVIKCS